MGLLPVCFQRIRKGAANGILTADDKYLFNATAAFQKLFYDTDCDICCFAGRATI